jgi:hypothetical protein
MGVWTRDLRTALPSAPAQHVEQERLLAQVELCLGLGAKLVSPGILHISKVLPQTIVPVIDGAPRHRHLRVPLDTRIAERDERLYVARVERLAGATYELDVLLRHALSLIRVPERRRAASPHFFAFASRDKRHSHFVAPRSHRD